MVVFPEGTCTNRKSLIKFKRGAFVPGAPVQTILLRWPYRFFDPTWTSSTNRIVKIFRLLSQVRCFCIRRFLRKSVNASVQIYNMVEVEFLPPYIPE